MKLFNNDLEPLAFLHAWRDCKIDKEKGHRKSSPTEAEVRKFYTDHYRELEAIKDLFITSPSGDDNAIVINVL